MIPEYDDLFVYAPSFILAEAAERQGTVLEGKAIGSARIEDLALKHDIMHTKDLHVSQYARQRKTGSDFGRKRLADIQAQVEDGLTSLIRRHYAGRLSADKLQEHVVKIMKTAWKNVFLAGIRAGGTTAAQSKTLDSGDAKWLAGATAHEMRFLNGFVDAVVERTGSMPYERRAKMYADTLGSFYESARVIALPFNTLIYWTGPDDHVTCPGCRYMFEQSPFTKLTICCTPKSGATQCLSNCRDRLLIRRVEHSQALAVSEANGKGAADHLRALRRIKQRGY